jgi:hypothetical protein
MILSIRRIIRGTIVLFLIHLSVAIFASAQKPAKPKAAERSRSSVTPLYSISFQRGEPVAGVAASRAIALPFQCTSDGTVFVDMMLQSLPSSVPVEQLVSIPPSGEAHEFRLDQVTDLYDVLGKGYYASESSVAFLVIAASEDKQGKEAYVTSDGTKHEVVRNLADHHDYIVIFDREGNYNKKLQMEDTFAVQRLGAFPSGAFLVLGFDKLDHSPRLALLQDDAKFLRFLELHKGDAPRTMFGMKDRPGKGVAIYIAPSQLVPHGDSILIVQNKTNFPLLEVSEAGMIREIHPKLPTGTQIDTLIASDQNLYAAVNPKDNGAIYELNAQDGSVIRRFALPDGPRSPVACVHDGKFLSFEHGDGKLVPLIGTAEPAAASGK